MVRPIEYSLAVEKTINIPNEIKLLSIVLFLIIIIGLVFSYSRAAWISILVSFGFGLILFLRIKFKHLLLAGVVGLLLLFAFGSMLIMRLEENKQDSSGDFSEHIQSMTNIRSDASNLERINRWNCALKLFNEKPILGWGPGTYQFVYAPYQSSSDLTIISTDFGTGGTAHSEYLGPLAETGIPGLISVIVLLFLSIGVGMNTYYKLKNPNDKWILGAALAGLVSYWTHGLLNNFLDTDKASVPFWGFLAIIVIYSIRNQKNSTPNMVISSKT